MQKPESAQENKTLQLFRDFEIQKYLISAKRQARMVVNKNKKQKKKNNQ